MTDIDIPDIGFFQVTFWKYILKNFHDFMMGFLNSQIDFFNLWYLAFDTCCKQIYFVSLNDLWSILHVCFVLTYQERDRERKRLLNFTF